MIGNRKLRIGEILELAKHAVAAGLTTADALEEIFADLVSPGPATLEESKELEEVLEDIYGKENVYKRKKIAIIGSSGLYPEMKEHEMEMRQRGHAVRMPTLDRDSASVEKIVDSNKKGIQEADEVHLFWDGRSTGTILDLGMVIAFNKPLVIQKLEKKSIPEYVEKYAEKFKPKKEDSSELPWIGKGPDEDSI